MIDIELLSVDICKIVKCKFVMIMNALTIVEIPSKIKRLASKLK